MTRSTTARSTKSNFENPDIIWSYLHNVAIAVYQPAEFYDKQL